MSVIDIGSAWANGDQLTPAALNAKWTAATFNSSAVDDTSTALSSGAIIVKDLGITAPKIAASAVTTDKIAANAVTAAKMATTQDWSTFTLTLPADSVLTATITDANVTFAKLATAAVATQSEAEASTASKLIAANIAKYVPGVAKAHGVVEFASGSSTVSAALNCSLSATGSGFRTIALTSAMDGTDYVVVAQFADSAATTNAGPTIEIVDASTFKIYGTEDTGRSIHFTVHGTLA